MFMYIKTGILNKYIHFRIIIYLKWQLVFYLSILFLMSIFKAFKICQGKIFALESNWYQKSRRRHAAGQFVLSARVVISKANKLVEVMVRAVNHLLHCMVGMKRLMSRSDLWLFSALACPQMQHCRCALLTSLKTEKGKIVLNITHIVIRVMNLSSAEDSVFRCGFSWAELSFQIETNFTWSWNLVSYNLF